MAKQLELFNVPRLLSHEKKEDNYYKLPMTNADISFYSNFFSHKESDFFFDELIEKIEWQEKYINLYNKTIKIPRKTSWYGDEDKCYTYSGITMIALPWSEALLMIKKRIESVAKVNFNSVLLNLYQDGKDGISWHSDNEPELGEKPVIGSVSFGGDRRFMLKSVGDIDEKHEVLLTHGSLLLMKGYTQKHWLHQVPKTTKHVEPRINLTFRVVL